MFLKTTFLGLINISSAQQQSVIIVLPVLFSLPRPKQWGCFQLCLSVCLQGYLTREVMKRFLMKFCAVIGTTLLWMTSLWC